MEWTDKYSGDTYYIGVGRDTPPDRIQVKSYRDVLMEYRVHPEPKSLGPDGEPCHRATVGLLARRPVTASEVGYIGKESNALEAVQQGLVHDVAEVRAGYRDPADMPWARILPILQSMPVKTLALAARCSERMIKYLRQGKRRPSQKVETALIKAGDAYRRREVKDVE